LQSATAPSQPKHRAYGNTCGRRRLQRCRSTSRITLHTDAKLPATATKRPAKQERRVGRALRWGEESICTNVKCSDRSLLVMVVDSSAGWVGNPRDALPTMMLRICLKSGSFSFSCSRWRSCSSSVSSCQDSNSRKSAQSRPQYFHSWRDGPRDGARHHQPRHRPQHGQHYVRLLGDFAGCAPERVADFRNLTRCLACRSIAT
jgi:hypothetical protein